MTTNANDNPDENKGGENFDKVLNSLHETLKQNLEKTDAKLSEMSSKIEKVAKADAPPAGNAWDAEEDDDDLPITKKELKTVVSDLMGKLPGEMKKVASATIESKTNRQTKDAQALTEFKAMNRDLPEFNPDFAAAVKEEVMGRINRGRSAEDDDLLYDAAATVKWKWEQQGKPMISKETAQRIESSRRGGGSFDLGSPPANTGVLNEFQMNLAKALKVNPEKITQRLKNKG